MTHWFTSPCESVGILRGSCFEWKWISSVDWGHCADGVVRGWGLVAVGPILGFPFKEACLLGAGRVWG